MKKKTKIANIKNEKGIKRTIMQNNKQHKKFDILDKSEQTP